jgi:hypothetical protein
VGRTETLKSLEIVLESFLERAVNLKQDRLRILDGINRLDDLAKSIQTADAERQLSLTDRIGEWFAEHRKWAADPKLRPAERNRINSILGEIKHSLEAKGHATPATHKITSEIDRWDRTAAPAASAPATSPETGRQKIVLRRGQEKAAPAKRYQPKPDSIIQFYDVLRRVNNLYRDSVRNSEHLMTVLDDSLKAAQVQRNPDALMLSAMIIYFLKQNDYLVAPFVKRLKEAEQLQKQEGPNA